MTVESRTVELEEIQTAPIRKKQGGANWSPLISVTKAIKAANLQDHDALYVDPKNTQSGVILLLHEDASHRIKRTILHAGTGGRTLQLTLPDEVLDDLSITREEIDSEDPPEVAVYAGTDDNGNGVLALERAGQKTITIPAND